MKHIPYPPAIVLVAPKSTNASTLTEGFLTASGALWVYLKFINILPEQSCWYPVTFQSNPIPIAST